MKAFTKRRYHGFGQFWRELRAVWRDRRELRGILKGRTLDPKFRERIMLAITAVNQCRYCSFAHTRIALREGLRREEIDGFFQGHLENVPEAERTAVLYAQHWAEKDGMPDGDMAERLRAECGEETAAHINATLRMMRLNNLTGNTVDWLLHTISFGRLGGA